MTPRPEMPLSAHGHQARPERSTREGLRGPPEKARVTANFDIAIRARNEPPKKIPKKP
jgi:hypothetical protein